MLDNSVVLYGAGMSNSNPHRHDNLLVLIAGPADLTGGAHARYSGETPLANLHVTLLNAVGVPTEHFGNSTGQI